MEPSIAFSSVLQSTKKIPLSQSLFRQPTTKNRSRVGHVLTGNECYTIGIVCEIVFVMAVDNECLECTKSIAIKFFR